MATVAASAKISTVCTKSRQTQTFERNTATCQSLSPFRLSASNSGQRKCAIEKWSIACARLRRCVHIGSPGRPARAPECSERLEVPSAVRPMYPFRFRFSFSLRFRSTKKILQVESRSVAQFTLSPESSHSETHFTLTLTQKDNDPRYTRVQEGPRVLKILCIYFICVLFCLCWNSIRKTRDERRASEEMEEEKKK